MSLVEDVITWKTWNGLSPHSWTHTPSGTPVGVLLFLVQSGTTNDRVTSVTYGGVPMSRVRYVADASSPTELGASYVYVLGSGVPSGAQSVSVTNTGGEFATWTVTFTGTTNLGVSASASTGVLGANPSLTMPTNADFAGIAYACSFSGQVLASITAGSGYTLQAGSVATGHAFGASSSAIFMSGAKTGANVVADYTCVSDDVAFIAVAVMSPAQHQQYLVKDAGIFTQREADVKIAGVFGVKPRKVKIGGSFV